MKGTLIVKYDDDDRSYSQLRERNEDDKSDDDDLSFFRISVRKRSSCHKPVKETSMITYENDDDDRSLFRGSVKENFDYNI